MRAFLLKAIYFLLTLTVLSVIADFLVTRNLRKSKTYASGEYTTWNDIYEGDVNADVVIYGSSRAVVQIDPSLLGDSLRRPCYNLGIDGHNFWGQHFRHQEYLKYNEKPRIIIHSLDVTTLSSPDGLFNANQFLPYLLYDSPIEAFTKPYHTFSYIDYRLPLVRYVGNRTALLHAASLLVKDQPSGLGRVKGYEGHARTWNDDLAKARKKFGSFEVILDRSAMALFTSYLEQCRSDNINIVLVYTPQHVEGQRFVKNLDAILSLYKDLSVEYQIPFLDYSHDKLCEDRSLFYNSGHLNKAGSQVFTALLAQDLKKLGLSK